MAAIFFRRANVFGVRAVSTARTLLDSASGWLIIDDFLFFGFDFISFPLDKV